MIQNYFLTITQVLMVFYNITANVLSLCVRAGLEALSYQFAPMPNKSTKLELTTSARMTQNEC